MSNSTPSPADLRRAVRRWRRGHRSSILAGVVLVALLWAGVVVALHPGETTTEGSPLRWPLTAAASSGGLTVIIALAAGHMIVARLGWPRHFARLPRSVREAWRRTESPLVPAVAGGLIGLVGASYLHPSVTIGLAACAFGLGVTDVGRAVISGARHSLETWREVAGRRPGPPAAALRLLVVAGGFVGGITALTRLFLLDANCATERLLGAPCSANVVAVVVVAALGAIAVLPLFLSLGAMVSLTLDGHPLSELAGHAGAPPTPAPADSGERIVPDEMPVPAPPTSAPASATPVQRGEPDEPAEPQPQRAQPAPRGPRGRAIVDPVGEHEDELVTTAALQQVEADPSQPDADAAAEDIGTASSDSAAEDDPTDELPPVSPPSDDIAEADKTTAPPATTSAPTEPGPEPGHHLERLEPHLARLSADTREHVEPVLAALSDLTPARTQEIAEQVASYEGTITTLRAQYRRAPGIAKGAIERACMTGLRGAGVDAEHARRLATALLTLDDEDWTALREALDSLREDTSEHGGPNPA